MTLYDKWKESITTVYDSQESSTLELLEDITNFTDDIAKGVDDLDIKLKDKTDINGDHKGTWQGLNRPTLSEEGMRSTVEKLDKDLTQVNSQLEHIVKFFTSKGYELDATKLDTATKVANNWNKLKQILNDFPDFPFAFKTYRTLNSVFAEWISGRNCPVGFYSDSTTDGATTTGHVSNIGTTTPFQVTINNSPNAYPTKLEEYIRLIYPNANVKAYNGGFDSQSYANGFGLRHWYNTWFRGLGGSNVDYSDVKMIVLGFGTSDSINMGDTASVIDKYEIDLECTIVDCLLRGVQPVLQAPVLTTQHAGTTVSYRNGDESITIIESIQKKLCKKYNLEYLSLRESIEKVLDGFKGMKYLDFIAPDMVHPNDMGHRLIASYLVSKFNPNIPIMDKNQNIKNIFAGHPSIIMAKSSDIVSPDSKGGLILKPIPNGYVGDNSFYYNWRSEDGNGKVYNEALIKIPIYVEKPTILFYNNIDNRGTLNKNKTFNIFSSVLNSTMSIPALVEQMHQPEELYYSNKSNITLLPCGLNIITINANNNPNEQRLGGILFADALQYYDNVSFDRGATDTSISGTKLLTFPPILNSYTKKFTPRKEIVKKYYNSRDNYGMDIFFTLETSLNAGTTYQIYTHYNDIKGYQDGYNLIEILGDVVTLKVGTSTGVTTINTNTITGLNALLVSGAKIKLRFTSKNSTEAGVIVQMYVNEILKYSYSSAVDSVWSEGYGFDAPNVICSNISIVSRNYYVGFDLQYLF